MRLRSRLLPPILLCALLLAGCDQLGIETPAKIDAAREAEGRAVGGACRHSGRALEDCYTLNPKAEKAAVYSGWRDMDAYMRENSIETVPAVLPKPGAASKKKKDTPPAEAEAPAAEGKTEQKDEKTPAAPSKGAAQSAVETPLPVASPGRKSA